MKFEKRVWVFFEMLKGWVKVQTVRVKKTIGGWEEI